ncbi:MAG: class I tRNA ligase family protein [Candidatus Woesearchaeota archaeon]
MIKGQKNEKEIRDFINKVVIQEKFTRAAEDTEKEGIFLGKYAINPVNGDKVPIYVANFVLMDYGTGAIMAVPCHDQRDFEFAKKYNIPLKLVIQPEEYEINPETMSRAFVEDGYLINSAQFSGMKNKDAIESINNWLEKEGKGKTTTQYKMRDWLVSRQRYWGTPIPFIHCNKCGVVPVPRNKLPVLLPEKVEFTGEGNPLAGSKEFVDTKCPKCHQSAKRETDTMDTFFDSSWYFFRYCSPKENKSPFDKKRASYWMPVDQYIGGAEHAVMHLLYSRFFTKALRDLGYTNISEATPILFNQGMLHKNGFVMSKSRGNVVTQEQIEETYGIDTARVFLNFIALPDKDVEWTEEGIEGSYRFINKFYNLLLDNIKKSVESNFIDESLSNKDKQIISKVNKSIKEVTEAIETFRYPVALTSIMMLTNRLQRYISENPNPQVLHFAFRSLILIFSPFAPHICEELWEKMGHKSYVSLASWPKYDDSKIDDKAEYLEDLISDVIADIHQVLKLTNMKKPKEIFLFVADSWKYDFAKFLKDKLKQTFDQKAIQTDLMKSDLKKYGQEIIKLLPKYLKDTSKLPREIISQEEEIKTLQNSLEFLSKEFSCPVVVYKAEESNEQKAKQALPGKPAIVIK